MDITQDVIIDLLPVYYSGDASPATRTLVDDFLARNPALAERVRKEWTAPLGTKAPAFPVAQSVELKSLRRTRRVLSMQRWLFSLGLTFTLLPLSVVIPIQDGRPAAFHFLVHDYPSALLPLLGAAAVCWALYARLRQRVKA